MCAHEEEVIEEPILLIHGTFAYDDKESGDRWWQRSSQFCVSIEELLNISSVKARPVPEGKSFSYIPPWWKRFGPWKHNQLIDQDSLRSIEPESVFHWSGDNTEKARSAAAELLLVHLRTFNARGPFHVIAHSHGGSILWRALCLAQAELKVKKSDDQEALSNLKSWTTIGTPFIHFASQYKCLIFLLPLLALVYLICIQSQWLVDLVQQLPESETFNSVGSLFTLLIFYISVFFSVTLVIRLLWSIYYYFSIVEPSPLVDEIKEREFDDIISTCIGVFATALIAVLVDRFFLDQFTLTDSSNFILPLILATIWGVTFLIIGLLCLVVTLAPLIQWLSLKSWEIQKKTCWNSFGSKYLCLAISQRDEAIQSLEILSHGLKGTLLPRISVPRLADFSPSRRHLRRPERELNNQSAMGWLMRYFFLPIAIIRDWVIAPFYNEVFATLIDKFVLGQLHRRAIGTNTLGPRVVSVSDHPMTRRIENSESFNSVYPKGSVEELQTQVNDGAINIVDCLRTQLGSELPLGFHLQSFLRDAMNNVDEKSSLLFHTSYFDSPLIKQAIVAHISDPLTNAGVSLEASISEDGESLAFYENDIRDSAVMSGFIWWFLRGAIKLGILMSPVFIALVIGLVTIYPYSLQYHLTWASDFDNAIIAANKEIKSIHSDSSNTVQWWIGYRTLNPNCDDSEFGKRLKDPFKRFNFYACLGEKYSRLGAMKVAEDAFFFSAKEYSSLSEEHQRNAIVCISGNLYRAKVCVGEVVFRERIMPVVEQGLNNKQVVSALYTELGITEKSFDETKRDLYQTTMRWAETSPTDSEIIEWINQDSASPQKRLNRIRRILGYWKNAIKFAHLLKKEAIGAANEIKKETKDLPAKDRISKFPQIECCIYCLVAIGQIIDKDSQYEVNQTGWEILRMLDDCPELCSKIRYPFYLKLNALLCRADQSTLYSKFARSHLLKMIKDIDQRNDLSIEQKQQLTRPLTRVLPSFYQFKQARHEAEISGLSDFEMEIASTFLLHQCEHTSPHAFGVNCTPSVTRLLLENDLIW